MAADLAIPSRILTRLTFSSPDAIIFRFLSEIRQDATIRNRGAVFTTKVKDYLRHAGRDPADL